VRFARVKIFPGPPLLSRQPCMALVCRLVSQFPVVVFYNINLCIRVFYGVLISLPSLLYWIPPSKQGN